MSLSPKRIYLRLPNWVGDVVLAEPAIRAMRESFPDAEIEIHGKAHTFGFIRAGGYYNHEIPLQRTKGPLWPIKEGYYSDSDFSYLPS